MKKTYPKTRILPALAGAVLSIGSTHANTIAYWRFEGDGVTTPTAGTQVEDSNGRTTTATGVGIRAIDSSGNGNTIWAWEHAWAGHTYETDVPWSMVPQTGAANGFFAKNAGDYPALFTWSSQSSPTGVNIDTWTSLTWTIEASFYTSSLGAYRTVVGREGNGVNTANASAAPLYFQMQNNNLFRIAYVDASGVERSVADTVPLTANVWYSYAATCDGATLKLYRKSPSDSAYVLAGSLDVSGSSNAALINPGNDMNGDPWGWTLGRGRYGTSDDPGQNHGDRWFGGIDEVRISDVALDPSLLLASPAVTDSDNDGLPDAWETAHNLDPNDDGTTNPDNGASGDPDNDTYSNLAEYNAGSDPRNINSIPGDIDGDGLPDTWEQTNFGNLDANPGDDPDGDYGTNLDEYNDGTDPNDRLSTLDADTDGMGDDWESHFFGDTSHDGTGNDDSDTLTDLEEWQRNTDPGDANSPYHGTSAITWSTPATVTSNTDIDLTGLLVHAGNFRSDNAAYTVAVGSESIPFENRQTQNAAGDLTFGEEARVIAGAGGRQVAAELFDATGTTISANFEAVLDGSAWENADPGPAPGATDMILRVTGLDGNPLTAGDQYQIQLFYSDDRTENTARGQRYHDGLGSLSDEVLAGNSTSIVGTFTASADGYQDIFIQNTTGGANFPVGLNAYVLRVINPSDSDNDGLPDAWEIAHSLDPNDNGSINPDNGADGDPDSDGATNAQEYAAGSDPQDFHSIPGDIDGDELPDSWETANFGDLSADTYGDPDDDYGTNIDEYTDGTDPKNRLSTLDEDTDGMGDYWEDWFFFGTSRDGTGDYDNDGLTDLQEWTGNTDPIDEFDPYQGLATVTWGSPITVTSNSDIITTGALVHAGNFRSDNTDVTVTAGAENILFANRQTQNAAGDLTPGEEARVIAGAGGRQVNGELFDATGTTVSANFESVLDGSAWENADPGPAPGATDMILRVTGAGGAVLTEGQKYQIQLFYSDDRAGSSTRGQLYHDGRGHASASLLASASSYVVGTFTAPAAGYMDIYIQNTSGEANFPVGINAYVLRTVPTSNDADADGMDDTWETTYFGNTSQPATGDFDGDGTDNLTEFRLGLIPNDGSSAFAATTGTVGQLQWPSAEGVTFTVQRSTTLDGWSDIATVPGTAGTASYTDPSPPSGAAFYRILLQP